MPKNEGPSPEIAPIQSPLAKKDFVKPKQRGSGPTVTISTTGKEIDDQILTE